MACFTFEFNFNNFNSFNSGYDSEQAGEKRKFLKNKY